MAEFSLFWTTGTTGDGLNPYTDAQLHAWLRRTFNSNEFADRGPLKGYGGELAVTATGPGTVQVATGAAYVYGIPYENDTPVNLTIPTPAANTRIDRIVLRANWTAKTVRITRLAGTEGAGVPPAITQTPGSIYDVKLAQVAITTSGVITVTDERKFCRFASEIGPENIANRTRKVFIKASSTGDTPFDSAMGAGPFGPTVSRRLGFAGQIPVDFAGNAKIAAIIRATDVGNVWLQLSVFVQPVGSTNYDSFLLNEIFNIAVANTGLYRTSQISLTGDQVVAGALIRGSFFRDGAHSQDTNPGDLYCLGFELEYTADS